MTIRQIQLKLALDHMGIPCEISSFSDRILPQKSIYIAQECGVDFGYYFGKYALGPYSPELEDELNAIRCDIVIDDEYKCYKLSSDVCGRLSDVKSMLIVPKYAEMSEDEWAALLSAIVYVAKEGDTLGDIKDKLGFDCDRVIAHTYLAVRVANKYGMIPASIVDEWEYM